MVGICGIDDLLNPVDVGREGRDDHPLPGGADVACCPGSCRVHCGKINSDIVNGFVNVEKVVAVDGTGVQDLGVSNSLHAL